MTPGYGTGHKTKSVAASATSSAISTLKSAAPPDYAITGVGAFELSDRWEEAFTIRERSNACGMRREGGASRKSRE